MLEATFRSIIQFRKQVGSIHAHARARTHRRTPLPWCLYAFCMFLSHRWRVCHVLKGMATQAASSLSSRVTRPLRSNNGDSCRQRPGSAYNSLSGSRPHAVAAPASPGIVSKKIFNTCSDFHSIISIGVMGAMFMKHAEGPGNLQPIDLYFSARCCQA